MAILQSAIEIRKNAPKTTRKGRKKGSKLKTGMATLTKSRTDIVRTVKKGKKKQVVSSLLDEEDDTSMFAKVRKSFHGIDKVVDDWIALYSSGNEKEAVADLVSFVFHSSGCVRAEVNPDELETTRKIEEHINEIADLYPEVSDAYPILSNHSSFKNFNKHYVYFWDRLISECSESIIYDELFSTTLLEWIETLSLHRIRAFRHTATLAAYAMMDAYIQILLELQEDLSRAQKQKKQKRTPKKKVKDLSENIKTLNEQIESIETIMMEGIVEKFLMKRYIDVAQDIRGLTVECLGKWIMKKPEIFLKDSLLRYLGWLLNDRHAGVRESVIDVLSNIYSNEDFHGHLVKFTKKFFARYVDLIEDTNISVAVAAMKFCCQLQQEGFFNPQDKSFNKWLALIEESLLDENLSIRYYASQFIWTKLNADSKTPKKSKKGRRKKTNPVDLDTFIDYLTSRPNFANQNVVAHLVDNLWGTTDLFRNFELIKERLLEADDDKEIQILLRILSSAIQKINQKGEPLFTTSDQDTVKIKTKPTKKSEKIDYESLIEEITGDLLGCFPDLLTKFQAEAKQLNLLLILPQYFQLSAVDSYQQTENFRNSLHQLQELVWKHTDESILSNLMKIFTHFLSESQQYSVKETTQNTFETLLRSIRLKLSTILTEISQNDSEENQFTLIYALQRMEIAIKYSKVPLDDLRNHCLKLINVRNIGGNISSQASVLSSRIILFDIVRTIKEKPTEDNDYISFIQEYHDELISGLQKNVSHEEKLHYFYHLSDLFVSFHVANVTENQWHLITNDDQEVVVAQFFEEILQNQNDAMQDEDDETVLEFDQQKVVFAFKKMTQLLTVTTAARMIAVFVEYGSAVSNAVKKSLQLWRESHDSYDIENEALQYLFEQYLNVKGKKEKEVQFEKFFNLAQKLGQTHFPGRDTSRLFSLIQSMFRYAFHEERHFEYLQATIPFISRLTPRYAEEALEILNERLKSMEDDECPDVIAALKKVIQRDHKEEEEETKSQGTVTKKLEFSENDSIKSKNSEIPDEEPEKVSGKKRKRGPSTKKKSKKRKT